MEARLQIDGLNEAIDAAVTRILEVRLREQAQWPYYTSEEAATLLQITVRTLLDKRKGYLSQLEYSKQAKTFWFLKVSLLEFVQRRSINKKFRGVELKRPRRLLNRPRSA